MTNTITIPRTADAAVRELGGLGELLTATEWHRAAIIAALVGPPPGKGRRTDLRTSAEVVGVPELAALGITGLRSTRTIERYRDAWFDSDLPTPLLGGKVQLPDAPWPPTRTGTDGYSTSKGAEATIHRIIEQHGPDVLAAAIAEDAAVAAAARRGIAERNRQEDAEAQEYRDRVGRNAEQHVGRRVGLDPIANHLQTAAAEVGAAILHRDLHGVTEPGQVEHALAQLHDYLDRYYTGNATWTDADDTFLSEHGARR